MYNDSNAQARGGQGSGSAAAGGHSRARAQVRGAAGGLRRQQPLVVQGKQKSELSDVLGDAPVATRSKQANFEGGVEKENINTKNKSEVAVAAEPALPLRQARAHASGHLRRSPTCKKVAENHVPVATNMDALNLHGIAEGQANSQFTEESNEGRREDVEMFVEGEVASLEEQAESDSVSLICQEKVDEATERLDDERQGVQQASRASQGEIRAEDSDVGKEEAGGSESGGAWREGGACMVPDSTEQEQMLESQAQEQTERIESILRQAGQRVDHVMRASPSKPRFPKSASTVPPPATDDAMQCIGLMSRQGIHNLKKDKEQQQSQPEHGKRSMTALLRTPSQRQQDKLSRNLVPADAAIYQMAASNLQPAMEDYNNDGLANGAKIISPDLPKTTRRITMPIKPDMTTTSFSFRRQSPEHRAQGPSDTQMYRGTPQRTPQSRSRLAGFNQSASQRILAQLSSSPVQPPFRKRYSLMQSKPTINNLKDPDDNQSQEPYGRLLSVNSGDSCNNTPNKHHFDQFLGTKGRSKAAYEKSSFDSPQHIDSGMKEQPTMKYTYLNQFSANRKMINSHQKTQVFMSQDMKTPIKESHKSNVTPQKINDYQTLQHNQDMADDNNGDDDKRFSSNTTKKFVTRMHGGSVIRSNFKVNPHSVQKNKIRSDSKSKSKQTSSSQRDMGICRQLHFDTEAPMQSPCFNSRDPTSKKFGALHRGGLPTGNANQLNMMGPSDRWPGLQMPGMQHQPFLDEKFFQPMAPFQQGHFPGPQHQRQMLEAAQLSKLAGNRATMNASLSPHNNLSSIYGLSHAQQMQQFTGRTPNPFGGQTMPRHQSSRKKNKKGRKKQGLAGGGERNEGMEVEEPMVPFPYILQPIINIGGQMPNQLKKIYQVGTTFVSPERKKPGGGRPNDSSSTQLGKAPIDREKPHPFRADGSDAHMADLGGETSGLKPRRRQRCNSSSETIKINGPNDSSQKQRVTNNSVITASDRRHHETPGAASEESSSSEYSDEDDEDESSGSSPQYPHSFYKHVQLLQQQQEANAQFFGDNRMRLRLDDGVLTAMPPQQQVHPIYYPQHLRPEHEHPIVSVLDQPLHQTISDCTGAAGSPSKLKKGFGQHGDKCHNQGRHHHKVKMVCSCGLWQEEHHCSPSNRHDSPVSCSTGKKPRQKSSIRKQRKREMKEKLSHVGKYAPNHFFNARSPNGLASYNAAAAGMMMPPYFGADSHYQHLQAINFMVQPSFLLGNINIVAGMSPHHYAGLNQFAHHQMGNLASYSPLAATSSAAFHPLGAPGGPHSSATQHPAQMLLSNQFPGTTSAQATAESQQWAKKDRPGASGAAAAKSKEGKGSKKAARLAKKRDRIDADAGAMQEERGERLKRAKLDDEWSDGGVIEIRKAGEKAANGDGKTLLELQRQLTFSNQKDVAKYENRDDERGGVGRLIGAEGFEGCGKMYKRLRGSEVKRLDGSDAPESSIFKSPDQQQQMTTRAANDVIELPSQRKRTKGKSKKKAEAAEAMTEQLALQNLHSFNPNFVEGNGSHMQENQQKQKNQAERGAPQSQQKKRSAIKDDLIQITPDQKSKMEQGNRGHAALGQVYYAQTGQKKASHGGDGLNMMKQVQARMNGVNEKGNTGNSLTGKMFGFNNQMASADKIQVQKFNQNGLMDLNPVITAPRNDLQEIRILNPQKDQGVPQASDDHYTVSLSQMNGKKQPLTDQQQAYMNQSSFQNSTVKDYPISTGNNLEKTTLFNNSLLALHNPMMPAPTSSRQRQGSSTKKASNTNRFESAGGAVSNANAPSTNQGKRLTQQEKELQNHQNEENIRRKTEKIIGQTITQQELFAKEMVTQCKGCKCRNTRCLKLYCECLRNNATCGPACQCTRQGGECHNNAEHELDRKKAVEEILKRNIDAFESKVDSHKKMHFKGCKCKASECQKKYCECFERGVPCTPLCKCSNCRNPFQTLAGSGKHEHDGESCPGHHIGEDLIVEDTAGAAASANLAAGLTDVAQDLDDLQDEEIISNQIDGQIVENKDEPREMRETNKEIESHDVLANICNEDIKRSHNLKVEEQAPEEKFSVAELAEQLQEPEQVKEDKGQQQGADDAVQLETQALNEKQRSLILAVASVGDVLDVANPEELPAASKPTKQQESEQPMNKKAVVDKQVEQTIKTQVPVKEQRQVADHSDRYPTENCENFNMLNIRIKAVQVAQNDDALSRAQQAQAESEMITKKSIIVRKEPLQASFNIQDEPQVQLDWSKREDEACEAQEPTIKKQISQSSHKASKPASRSKRLAEKASKESGKLFKQSRSKARPSPQTAAAANVCLEESPSLPAQPPSDEQIAPKAPALLPKKAQSSLSLAAQGQQQPQAQRRTKPPAAPQEKMQTRHQKKLLQKQLNSEKKQHSSQEK